MPHPILLISTHNRDHRTISGRPWMHALITFGCTCKGNIDFSAGHHLLVIMYIPYSKEILLSSFLFCSNEWQWIQELTNGETQKVLSEEQMSFQSILRRSCQQLLKMLGEYMITNLQVQWVVYISTRNLLIS